MRFPTRIISQVEGGCTSELSLHRWDYCCSDDGHMKRIGGLQPGLVTRAPRPEHTSHLHHSPLCSACQVYRAPRFKWKHLSVFAEEHLKE